MTMQKHPSFIPLRLTGLALALLAAYPALAQSQDQPQSQAPAQPQAGASVPTLGTVTVTASELSPPVSEVTDLKASDTAQAASSGADYLKTVPGFSAIRSGGTNGDPVLRGMFGSRLNILTDGTSMIGACPGRMDAPSAYIAPENFDAVTVVKGPETVIWGPGASAGTVRFDRDTQRFTAPGLRFDGSVGGGSFDRNEQLVDLTAGSRQFYARLTANHTHSGDYKDGGGNTLLSRWDKRNADLTLGFTPDADTLLEVTAGGGNGYAAYAGRGMDATKLERQSLGARFVKSHIGSVLDKIEAQVYFNEANMVMDNITFRSSSGGGGMGSGMGGMGGGGMGGMGGGGMGGMGGMGGGMAMVMADNRMTTGGRLAATWHLGTSVDLVTGVDAQASRHRGRSGTDTDSYTNYPWVKDATLDNTGLFAEATWRAAQRNRVIGGARLDWASAKDEREVVPLGPMGMMTAPNPAHDQTRRKTLPSGFVRYEQDLASAPATWYVGLGHVERFPDYWELFSDKLRPPDFASNGTSFQHTQPEKTTQLDFGARYKTEKLELWASGYIGYVQDFILFNYMAMGNNMMGGLASVRNVNASIWGGELGTSYQLTPQWQTGATLAWAWGENRTDNSALPQIPPLEVHLSVAYNNGPWAAGALWRLVASQRRFALNQGNVGGQDFGPSAGFGTLSLHASYAFNKQTKLVLGVDNLFNKTYSEHLNMAGNSGLGFPGTMAVNEPGRTLWARLNVKF
jgi:iron complex outermembrane receptor protein